MSKILIVGLSISDSGKTALAEMLIDNFPSRNYGTGYMEPVSSFNAWKILKF